MAKYYKVRLKRSRICTSQRQRAALDCLKLRKIDDEVVVKDDPAMLGQIFRLQHLLEISETTAQPQAAKPRSTKPKAAKPSAQTAGKK